MFGRRQQTRAPASVQQYKRISDEKLASHMKARLENAEKVKENGPKLAGQEFKLGDRVVAQNPLTKLWDTHGIVSEKLSKRRYRIQTDEGYSFFRNVEFIRLSATSLTPEPPNPPTNESRGSLPQEDNALPPEVVVLGQKPTTVPPARRQSSKRTKRKPKRYLD